MIVTAALLVLGVLDLTLVSRRRDDVSPLNCDSAHRRLEASYSFPSAKASAVIPLSRHCRIRSAHFSRVCLVIMRPTVRPPRRQPTATRDTTVVLLSHAVPCGS
jgi:hypothetical protein